jgi:hypothetical protein
MITTDNAAITQGLALCGDSLEDYFPLGWRLPENRVILNPARVLLWWLINDSSITKDCQIYHLNVFLFVQL